MKSMFNKPALMFLIFIAFVIILLVPYFLTFSNGFSYSSADWAAFGTYVGAVVTPLTILLALWTIAQNEKIREEEIKRMVGEGSKADVRRFIERIESDIDYVISSIDVKITDVDNELAYNLKDLLFKIVFPGWEKVLLSKEEFSKRDDLKLGDSAVTLYELCALVAMHIERLKDYCRAYDELSSNNATSLYFSRKYRVAIKRLNEKGYDVGLWDINPNKSVPKNLSLQSVYLG